MNVIVLVVTYNRVQLLRKCISGIMGQSYRPSKILIVDNASTDGTEDFCIALKREKPDWIEYLRADTNTGGAGGFSIGLREIAKMEIDYVWGMDDDAVPYAGALESLVKKTDTYGLEKYCLTSNVCYIDHEGKIRRKDVDRPDQDMAVLTFVGFFLPRKLIELIGYPREDLFIYFDDADYSVRIREAGYHIIGVLESVIEHPYIMPDSRRNLMGKQVSIPEMCDWKLYYWMRNNLLVQKKREGGGYGRKYFRTILLEAYIVLKIFIFERKNFAIAAKGFWHGLRAVSGHLEGYP